MHLVSWLLRGGLLALAAFQLATRNTSGAIVAFEGFVVSLAPLGISRLSRTRVPRPLELAFVFGMALQFGSESTKLFELFYYWDKLVHPTLVALTGMISAWLLIGYRDAFAKRIPIHFVAAFGMLLAITVGAMWEFVEFSTDWFQYSDLQKSNGDTLTDIMSNDIGAFVATLLALYLYVHVFTQEQRQQTGHIAQWLAHGPLVLVRRYGRLVGAALTLVVVGLVAYAIKFDQGVPALAEGFAPGTSREWHFADSAPATDAQVLRGDWVPDPRGICRENLEDPKPGSEKMGILELTPGVTYGGDAFTIQTRYY